MGRTASADLATRIVAAACRVLADAGPHGLALRDVAVEAGVSVQSLYNRFGTKNTLLDDVATAGLRRLIAAMMDPAGWPLTTIDDPLLAIAEALRRYRRFALAEPLLHDFLSGDLPVGFVPSPRTQRLRMESHDVLVAATRLAMEAGLLLPGRPEAIAIRLWATVRGAIELELDDRDFEGAVATMIRGLRPSAQLR